MSLSTYLKNKILDHLFGGTAYTPPATIYKALHTADPTATGLVGELSGNAYARVAVTNDVSHWPNASGGSKSNAIAISFPTPTPSGWGIVTHYSYWDAPTGGNCLHYGALAAAKTINAGDPVSFPISSATVTAA